MSYVFIVDSAISAESFDEMILMFVFMMSWTRMASTSVVAGVVKVTQERCQQRNAREPRD